MIRCMRIKMLCMMLPLMVGLGACSNDESTELCFVGDSLVAGWDTYSAFPTRIVRNDGVGGAHLEDLLTWNLDYRGKDVVMLVGTNNMGSAILNDNTRPQFIADFVEEYRHTIETWAPRRVFVISILPRNFKNDNERLYSCIQELNLALSQMVESLDYGTFVDVYDYFLYEGKLNMDYSLDGLHLNDLGYNILNVRLAKEL